MSVRLVEEFGEVTLADPISGIRARAAADARRFRALARVARADGMPKAELRAANAKAAARAVLRHARELSKLRPTMGFEAVSETVPPAPDLA